VSAPRPHIVNLAELPGRMRERSGTTLLLEPDGAPFRDLGMNVRVLQPGRPACLYHSESVDEVFLVLSGECLAILGGEDHVLRTWDFLHCPPGLAHVIVGAGDGPSAVLMAGARRPGATIHYPVDARAAEFHASAAVETDDPVEAYRSAGWAYDYTVTEPAWPPAP
jgi:uncharacterized cupin superfamily protein